MGDPSGDGGKWGATPLELYGRLPWNKRGGVQSVLLVLAVVCWTVAVGMGGLVGSRAGRGAILLAAFVLLGVVSVCALAGTIVHKPKPGQNELHRWGHGNKVVAVILLLGIAAHLISVFAG